MLNNNLKNDNLVAVDRQTERAIQEVASQMDAANQVAQEVTAGALHPYYVLSQSSEDKDSEGNASGIDQDNKDQSDDESEPSRIYDDPEGLWDEFNGDNDADSDKDDEDVSDADSDKEAEDVATRDPRDQGKRNHDRNDRNRDRDRNRNNDRQRSGGSGGNNGGGDSSNKGGKDKDRTAGILKAPVKLSSLIMYRYSSETPFNLRGKVGSSIRLHLKGMAEPLDTIPTDDNGKVKYKRDEGLLEVTLNKGDFFAVEPDSEQRLMYRVYTPYTGRQVYFVMRESMRRHDRGQPFEMLMDRSLQWSVLGNRGRSILGIKFNKALFNKSFTFFDTRYAQIIEKYVKHQEKMRERRGNFRFRIGDVVKGYKKHNQELLITHEIFHQGTNKIRWVFAPIEHVDPVVSKDVVKYLYTDTTELSADPIRDHGGIYVRSVKDDVINEIRSDTSVVTHINNMLAWMGATLTDSSPYMRRDERNELPPKGRGEGKGPGSGSELGAQWLVYLESLPKQEMFTPDGKKEVTFKKVAGWYVVVERRQVTNSGKKDSLGTRYEWTLFPATDGKKIEIEYKVTPVARPTVPGYRPTTTNAPTSKTAQMDYVVIDLPIADSNSLRSLVGERRKYIGENAQYMRARKHVRKFDPWGNETRFRVGEIIELVGVQYIIADRKDQGKNVVWTLIPMMAIAKPDSSKSFWVAGENDMSLGYKVERFDLEGDFTLERQARRVAGIDKAKAGNFLKYAADYFMHYDEKGFPREKPLRPDNFKFTYDDGVVRNKRNDGDRPSLNPMFVNGDTENTPAAQQQEIGKPPQTPSLRPGSDNTVKVNGEPLKINGIDPNKVATRLTNYLDQRNGNPASNEPADVVSDLYGRNSLQEGMLIYYRWPEDNTPMVEIFYEYDPENKMLRLVPHSSFRGDGSGWVDVDGFAGLVSSNIIIPGFWRNFKADYYTDRVHDGISKFRFNMFFEEEFSAAVGRQFTPHVESEPEPDKTTEGKPDSTEEPKDQQTNDTSGISETEKYVLELINTLALGAGMVIEYRTGTGTRKGLINTIGPNGSNNVSADTPDDFYFEMWPSNNKSDKVRFNDYVKTLREVTDFAGLEITDGYSIENSEDLETWFEEMAGEDARVIQWYNKTFGLNLDR